MSNPNVVYFTVLDIYAQPELEKVLLYNKRNKYLQGILDSSNPKEV